MSKVSFKDQISLRLSTIIWFVLFCLFLLAIPTVKAWTNWLMAAVVVVSVLISAVIYCVYLIVRKARWRWRSYVLISSFVVFVLTSIVGLPIYYLSYVATSTPVAVPQVTLINGSRTVILQGMMHVGSESFYKSVVYDLENALTQGFHLYYEGVSSGNKESDQWFKDFLSGGKDLSGNYRNLAELCGLTFQLDYFYLLAVDKKSHPERHKIADISTAVMKNEFDRLMKDDAEFVRAIEAKTKNDSAETGTESIEEFVRWQQKGTPRQKLVSGIVCRGFMTRALLKAKTEKKPIDKLIVDFRNKKLADFIIADKTPKIYVTYGADHIKGVVDLLRKDDDGWNIKSIKWSRVIAPPDNIDGDLD